MRTLCPAERLFASKFLEIREEFGMDVAIEFAHNVMTRLDLEFLPPTEPFPKPLPTYISQMSEDQFLKYMQWEH